MYFTKEKIFNVVLNNLGISAVVQNTVEKTPRITVLNNYYDVALEQTMKDFDWNFLRRTEVLTPSVETSPDPKFHYCYDYPNDCIAARYVIDSFGGNYHKFDEQTSRKGERLIVCNIPNAKLQYTRRLDNQIPEAHFTPEFVTAFAYYLAYLSAQSIVNNAQIQQAMFQSYQYFIAKAKAMSANESEYKDEDDRSFVDYR